MAQCRGLGIISLKQTKWSKKRWRKIENPQGSETDKYNENISRLTALIDIPLVKSLRLANINRQLQDLITQCEAISKLTNYTVLKHQPMSSFTDRQIHTQTANWKHN